MTPSARGWHIFTMRKWLWISLLLVLAPVSLWQWDQPTSQWFARPENEPWRHWGHAVTDIALGEYWFGLALVIYVFTRWIAPRWAKLQGQTAKIQFWRNWSVNLFLALLGAGLILRLLKSAFGRQRPHKSEIFDPQVFEPMNLHWHFQSMPSGHTQVLFTLATVLTLLWPRGAGLFYAIAAVLSLTRVMTHQHFLSDVLAGAVVGVVGAWLVLSRTLKRWPVDRSVFSHQGGDTHAARRTN